jgi:hypothetical protein
VLGKQGFHTDRITKLRAISSVIPNGSRNEQAFRKFHLDAETAG